jgi:hypothetical protein
VSAVDWRGVPKAAAKPTRKAAKGKGPSRRTVDAGRPAAAPPVPPKPASLARLGDDLPSGAAAQAAPKLSREPVSIVVARTDIVAGGVRLKANAPSVLRVAKGQVVHVKHAYRLQEASPEKEEYRFLLKSALGGKPHAPSLARLGDQWGVPEDISGYLQHEYRMDRPGPVTLEFEAGAEYCVMGWGDSTVQALDRKDLSGKIDVVVV